MIVGQSHPIKMARNVYFRKQSRWPKQVLSHPRLRLCATGARRSRPGSAAPFKDSRGIVLAQRSGTGTAVPSKTRARRNNDDRYDEGQWVSEGTLDSELQ